jgi:REP element-mobilizing transposase RayT
MFIQPYHPHELRFAYCYRVYFRCRTRALRSVAPLKNLDRRALNALVAPYNLRVLQVAADETDILAILSLTPTETIAAAAGKLKGRISKWLAEALLLSEPAKILSQGYFACTIGKSRRENVERYLSSQAEHHGYSSRVNPPILVKQYELSTTDYARISPKHATVIAQFHVVLATRYRKGIFGSQQALHVSDEWLTLLKVMPIFIRKVSFVPDHVHIALRSHPSLAPADIVIALMNTAQQALSTELVRAGLDRLWEEAAYIGSTET